jgi:predicted transcriptional regulator
MSNIRPFFHPIRKALQLSLNEYAVLGEILTLSNNTINNGWCWKSKKNIADSVDLSERAVFNIITTLLTKGYIEKHPLGFLKPSDFIREIDQASNFQIYIETEKYQLASIKIEQEVKKISKKMLGEDYEKSS